MNTVHKLFIAVILAALSVPVFGQSIWKHPVANMQAENMTGLKDDYSIIFHLLFMKKDWLGFGIGLGGSSCEINDGVLKSGHIQVLEDDDNEIGCFNLEGCVLISPHIARIGKVDCFFDAQPSVRLQSQSSIKYGYVTPDGTPRVEKYKGNLIALNGQAGLGVKISVVYVGLGYRVSNGFGGKLKVKLDDSGAPTIKRDLSHGIYLTVGVRL